MATLGGPAKAVVVQTGGQSIGGPALPVAVVTDGRAVEGGPSMPVVVVTSGPVQGGPALPVVAASGAQASQVMAGRAIPVYVVSGSLSSGTAPVNTVLPAISGTLAIGQALTTTDGTWTGTAPITYTYQWQRNGVDIGGETNNTYTLTASDPGTTITVEVTATNAIGSASATSAGVTPSSLLTSLNAYWKLEEASGTRVDATGRGNDLNQNNGTPGNAAGRVGDAIAVATASSQCVYRADTADLSIGNTSFTLAAWVFPTAGASGKYAVSKWTNGTNPEYSILWDSGSNRFWFTIANFGKTVQAATYGIPQLSVWQLVIGWFDSAGQTLNISVNNGATDSIATAGTFPPDSTNTFVIGAARSGDFAVGWQGRIDEVGLWKRLLTPAERTTIYNGGSGITYPF